MICRWELRALYRIEFHMSVLKRLKGFGKKPLASQLAYLLKKVEVLKKAYLKEKIRNLGVLFLPDVGLN